MSKRNLIKIAIIIVILIIITITLLLFKHTFVKENTSTSNVEQIANIPTVEQIYMTNDYFTVKEIIKTFYKNCKELNSKAEDIDTYNLPLTGEELSKHVEKAIQSKENLAKRIIYGILDESYINEFGLKEDDIKQKFGIQNEVEIVIQKIYRSQNSTSISNYFIYGICIDTKTNQKEEFNFMIVLDTTNNTFSMFPKEYLQKHGYDKVNIGDNVKNDIGEVANNGYNIIKTVSAEDSTVAKEIFYNYKNSILYDTENAYQMLEETYREKKFGDLEEYKRYVQNNYDNIKNSVVNQYQVVEYDDIKEYVCLDQNSNYYIFDILADGNYKVYLDTYTIDLPQFTEKYNKANAQEKVALNINKFIAALNAQDYGYIYSKLADSFKNNYFENEESLKEYLVNNLYENNEVEFEDFAQEGTIYTYKIKVTKIILEDEKERYYGKNAPSQNVNIVMQLNEGTDFIMSFSIEE